ncbi:Retrovirus-related Pol polyprotein from transposon TNT 1-94 [Eumeta japonica]|uniref:Retrovirus-related Pol polyprotein from transposon TNT 1-94 n=1 Tax=Eumeta variegata TaxID=151549 RepID=A0A4C1WK14_EUMVA|nr:Retrovirus-related Pol polyprotein from transposon TNT 1-94 [Eumeta japonica]
MHIPKEKRLKWDIKSKPHILDGYAKKVKGHRIKDPHKKCVSVTMDVIIQENLKTNIPDNTSLGYWNTILQNVYEIPSPVESKKIRRPPHRYGFSNLSMESNAENKNDPVSVKQTLRGLDKDNWIAAMQEELQAFKENDAWVVVSEVPQGKTLVQCVGALIWWYIDHINNAIFSASTFGLRGRRDSNDGMELSVSQIPLYFCLSCYRSGGLCHNETLNNGVNKFAIKYSKSEPHFG